MTGDNCSIAGCFNSRGRNPEKSFFKVPGGKDEFNTIWAEKLIKIACTARVYDDILKRQIEKRSLHICSDHFGEDQMLIHESRITLIPGSIPTKNLPVVKEESLSISSEENFTTLSLQQACDIWCTKIDSSPSNGQSSQRPEDLEAAQILTRLSTSAIYTSPNTC